MIAVETAFQEFLVAAHADGLKPATLRWYTTMLAPVASELRHLHIDQVTANHLRAYIIALRERQARYLDAPQRRKLDGGLSAASLQAHHRALSRFFSWCQTEYELPANPMARIRKPAAPRDQPKAVNLADLKRLIDAAGTDRNGVRDRAILIFLADTGCRAGGLLGLRPVDVDLEHGRAIVREKGDKTRLVPFTRLTAHLLRAWLAVRPEQATTLFCSLSEQHYAKPFTLSGLHQMLKRLKQRSGVQGRVNPHSFRHGFARKYLINGGDLATLAQLMGHTTVAVTANYYAIFTHRELQERHQQFSPVAKWEVNRPSGEERS